jgi:hypothetical protein
MAEQPIKGSEVVDPNFLDDAIKKANEFLVVNKELTTVLSKNLSITKQSLSNKSVNNSNDLREQAALSKQAAIDLKNLEILKKSAAQTEAALLKVEQERQRTNRELAKSELEYNKQITKNNKDVQVITSSYDALRKKYNDLSRAQIELSVRGRENGKVFKAVKDDADAMRLALDKAEQGAGRHQRNVGNYASAYNGLGNSINQLSREMPAFANSVQTGFMAISNNLPIFFDQIERIKKENTALAAEGKKGVSVLSQLGGAIFSWGTALSLGVTLLTLYGKQMVEFIGTLFEAEKALESVTAAEIAYGKSIGQTQENIEDLKLEIKIKSGLISKETGHILQNENERKRAINQTKELRKTSLAELWKETDMSQKLLESDGKKRLIITQGGESKEENVLSYFEQKRVDRYKAGLARERDLMQLENAKVNEYYNLKAKLNEIDDDADKKKKIREEKIIDLTDRIVRQNIENETDTKQRAINLANDLERIAIKEVNAINATYKQKQLLILSIQQDTYNKLIEIDEKYAKMEIDKINAQYEKILEEKNKNIVAAQKILIDNKDYNLFLLEEQYNDEKKLGDKASKKKLEDLQKQIIEEKKLLIQKHADIEKEGKNEAEREAIQNKADIDKKKLRTEKQNDNSLKSTIDFSNKVIDILAKEEAKKSALRVEAFDKDIANSQANIDTQRRLAENGRQNTLAEEQANKVKLERQKEEEKQQEIKRQKALAFFKLFASYAEKDPNTALQKALRDTVIAETIALSFSKGKFIEGTENVARDLSGNKIHNNEDGYLINVDGRERILNPKQNEMVGNLSNEDLAKLAYDHNNGLLDTAKYGAFQSDSFAKNMQESALLMQTIALRKEIKGVKDAIENRPTTSIEFTKQGDYIESRISKGIEKRVTHKIGKRI